MYRKFLWQREDEPQNLLAYLFLAQNLVYGIGFAFFSHTVAIKNSAFAFSFFPLPVWGILFLSLFAFAMIGIATRNRHIGGSVGFLGVGLWSYGFVLYILEGSIFAAFAIYILQIFFWVFWHIGISRYFLREDEKIKNGR